ncbi:MAG: hypothetical protein Q4C50_09185 [Eubacteriales bacterium]|nr:hypothetical protein [Eubacteriales bacterium]
MKRKVAATVAAMLVLGAGIQALAAPSVTSGGVDAGQVTVSTGSAGVDGGTGETEAGTEEGVRVILSEINRDNFSEEDLALIDKVEAAEPEVYVADVLEGLVDPSELSEIKVFDTASLHLEDEDGKALLEKLRFLTHMTEVTFEGVEPTEEKPVDLTFTLNNMVEGMEVYVLGKCDTHGWELLETERVSDNQVKASFHAPTSLVAFTYLEDDQLPEKPVGTSPATAEDTKQSAGLN